MLTLLKDQTVYLQDVEFRVIRGSADQDTLLENKRTGERTAIKAHTLVSKYLIGEFKTAGQHKAALRDSVSRKPARMDNMSGIAKKETHRRIDYLVRLDKEGAFDGGRAKLRDALKSVADARGESEIPHETTVYRWRKKYLEAQSDVRALFARFDNRGGKGGTRLHQEVEIAIDEAVEEIAMRQRVFSSADLLDALTLKIQVANRQRPPA